MLIVPCIKCHATPVGTETTSIPGVGLEVFVRCPSCGLEGPHTAVCQDPAEHMDCAESRAVRMWAREQVRPANFFAKPLGEGKSNRYPAPVT